MSKDLNALINSLKIRDPDKKQIAGQILKYYSELSQELRRAVVPTLQTLSEDKDFKIEKANLTDISIELLHGLTPTKSNTDATIGTILFVLAFIGAVVNIPSFLLLQAESIYQRIIWRYSVLALLVAPRFIFDILVNITSLWDIFIANILPIFFLSLLNTAYVYMVYYAAQHTFVLHTVFLCSIGSTFAATWKIVKREPYTSLEYIGIGMCVFGSYLFCCEADPLQRREVLIGNLMAILSSAVHAIYASLSKSSGVIKSCPISVYLILMSGYVVGISFLLAFFFNERIDIFSTDDRYGLFAFITSWRSFVYGFVGLGVMAGFMYHYFTLVAQQYIGGMFLNVCYNFIPFTAQMTAFILGAQIDLPGTFTYIGGITLFLGCTLLAMNYQDQQYMAHIPLVNKAEEEVELPNEVMHPPIEPDYAQSSDL